MHIEVNTDANAEGAEAFSAYVRETVEAGLDRFKSRISRIEVHISALAANPTGHDKYRCVMEARLEGRKPNAVIETDASINGAVSGAVIKLAHVVEQIIGKQDGHR